MKTRLRKFFHSIQSRFILVMAVMLLFILSVNLYVFRQSSAMVRRIDSVFVSNSSIVRFTDMLGRVRTSAYGYLSTRASSSLEDFYRYEQQLQDLAGEFNSVTTNNETLMLEKNIRNMTDSYIRACEDAIQAKRGRDVEGYRNDYERSERLRGYINTYLYTLNSRRFEQNSTNYQTLQQAMNVLEASSLVMILAAFLLALFLGVMTTRAMIGPLRNLAAAADRVASGDLTVEVAESASDDEIGVVTNAFRKMLVSIRRHIEDQRTSMEKEALMKENELSMEARMREAQLKFLQAQINPHFLFNSLNAGSQLAAMEGADRTEDFLQRMADFFRYNVQKTQEDTTLLEEIQSADNYIYILNVRFAGDIHFRKEIDESIPLQSVRVPAMILQPLVENAVQHGIHDDHENGRIWLYVEKADEQEDPVYPAIRVTVSDNGAGMTQQQIRRIMNPEDGKPAGPEEKDSASNGIAMENVMARLRLYYGQEGLFRIWSNGPGEGTEAVVYLPSGSGQKDG